MDLKKYEDILPELEKQSKTAKEFYETDIIDQQIEKTRDKNFEFAVLVNKLTKYEITSEDIFLHLGAGVGTHVDELHKVFFPNKSIALDIADRNIAIMNNNLKYAQVKHENFFNIDFDLAPKGRLFIFLNWSVLSEFGSLAGVNYMLDSIDAFKGIKIIMGDLPFQTEYLKELLEYKLKWHIKKIGIAEYVHPTKNIVHHTYLPNHLDLSKQFLEKGWAGCPIVVYKTRELINRFIFEFTK